MKETKRMSLRELHQMPIKDALEKMEIADLKIHTDDDGMVRTIEIKYSNKDADEPHKRESIF